jgi:hypothetical protein
MKLVETSITETAIYIRLADVADAEKAWIDLQVPLDGLTVAKTTQGVTEEVSLGDPERRNLAVVPLAALRYAQKAIGDEIARLSNLSVEIRAQ